MTSKHLRVKDPNEVLQVLTNEIAQRGDCNWLYNVETGVIASKLVSLLEFVQLVIEHDEIYLAVQSKTGPIFRDFLLDQGFEEDTSQPDLPPLFTKRFQGGWKELGLQQVSDVLQVAIQLARLVRSSESPYMEVIVACSPLRSAILLKPGDVVMDTCMDKEIDMIREKIAAMISVSGRKHPPLELVDAHAMQFDVSRAIQLPHTEIADGQTGFVDDFVEDLENGLVELRSVSVRIPKTAQDFEAVCCEFLKDVGCDDAALTRSGPDGGVDVVSSVLIAQAKFHPSQKITVEVVRALAGSRLEFGVKHAILFHYGPGFTQEAVVTAKKLNILLLELDVDERCFRVVGSSSEDF